MTRSAAPRKSTPFPAARTTPTNSTVGSLDTDDLRNFLRSKGIEVSRPVWEVSQVQSSGPVQAHRVRSASHDLVVRRPSPGRAAASAQDIHREFKVIAALSAAGLPVPRPVAASVDSSILGGPFLVLQHVDGVSLRTEDDLYGLPDGALRHASTQLAETLAAIHDVDTAEVGIADLRRPRQGAVAEIEHWRRHWGRVSRRDDLLADEIFRTLTRLAPASTRSTVVHGDYWIGNLVLDRLTCSRVQAVSSWGRSGIGDPRSDLATMCAYHHRAVDNLLGHRSASSSHRMARPDDLLAAYCRAAGTDVEHWPFHLALAYLKLAVRTEESTQLRGRGPTDGSARLLHAAETALRESD